jgi:putative peptidoglycan lipid II flippase
MRIHLPRPRLTPEMRTLLKRMAPGLLGAGVTQLNLSVDVIIGSLLPPGTVAVLYYADRVNQLPLGTIGAAVGTALLPTLSRQVLGRTPWEAIGTLNRAIEYALVLTLPAALALIVARDPIISVLFGRGAFSAVAVAKSAQALAAYAFGLPAFVLVKVLIPGFFARGDTSTPVKIGMASIGLNLALNLAFMVPLQHMGPALASAIAAWANVAGLAWVLHTRNQFNPDALLNRRASRMVAATLAMGVALAGLQEAVFPFFAAHGQALRFVGLGLLVGGGMVAYGAAGQALGAFDMRELAGRLARRRSRAAAEG